MKLNVFLLISHFEVELRAPKRPGESTEIKLMSNHPQTATYSQLFVGGVGNVETLPPVELSTMPPFNQQLKQLSKFHGYIMNLQYTSLSSQCSVEMCSKASISQRQYAIYSLSTSKQNRMMPSQQPRVDLLTIDDICESDTLTHDICPKDCSCLSNNFVAPYFNCDCSEVGNITKKPSFFSSNPVYRNFST